MKKSLSLKRCIAERLGAKFSLSSVCFYFLFTLIYIDYCWFWDEKNKSDDVLVHNYGTEAYFHPDYSCGTAAIRGSRQFREGEEHYWEVQMSSAVYGTDMVCMVYSFDGLEAPIQGGYSSLNSLNCS